MPALRLALAYPRTSAVLLVTLWSLAALAASWWPVTPLSERAGFAEAVSHLAQGEPRGRWVLVWPPEQAAALDALPRELMAADALPIEAPARRRFRRVDVLGPRGVLLPPEVREPARVTRRSFGEVDVVEVTYEGGESVLFELQDELARVVVRRLEPTGAKPCDLPHPSGGFACRDAPEWNHVGPTVLRVDGGDWPAVWAHPVSGATLELDLGERELGERVLLEAALSDEAARTPDGAPVYLELRVGEVSRRLVRGNAPGVARLEVPTPQRGRAAIRLAITTPHDGRRHFGVNLRIVEGATP